VLGTWYLVPGTPGTKWIRWIWWIPVYPLMSSKTVKISVKQMIIAHWPFWENKSNIAKTKGTHSRFNKNLKHQ
jgi:hypothetical protein